MRFFHLLLPIAFISGFAQNKSAQDLIEFYQKENKDNDKPSISTGTVSGGTLQNGKLMPFQGSNFRYFDSSSYLSDRAFVHHKLKKTLLASYRELETLQPDRHFCLMECSNKNGGKIFPHRTHQNGLSVDFMVPLIKDNRMYYGLDSTGVSHYFLQFDDAGKYSENEAIAVDFDLVAQHILLLDKHAHDNGLKIAKVIIKIEFKDELFATANGKKIKEKGIYVVKSLTPLINSLHDDHYHIDFESLH